MKKYIKKENLEFSFLLYILYKNTRSKRFGTVIAKPVLNKK